MARKLLIPAVAEPLVEAIRQARVFTRPTFPRFIRLMAALIVTMGRRTVSRALTVMGPTPPGGHWSNYHRIYSQARFSMWRLAAVVVRQVVALLPADATIVLVADDTVDGKEGDHVWAKGAHRDPVRSSHGHDHVKFGHKWLVLCVLVTLRGMARPWALPILCGLCLSPKVAGKIKQRQKTPGQVTRQLLIRLMRWMPQRRVILIGDYQVVTHQTVTFAQRHADRVTAIGRLRGDANLYAPPANPRRRTRGGGVARKGKKIASPAERIEQLAPAARQQAAIQWYGGQTRSVTWVSETALWYDKHHAQVTPIRWVCVLGDQEAGLENAYFFSSDQAIEPARLIELYASRWNIEVTFEEARALLGLETTRHWCRQSVLRVTPILLGLFTAVGLLWQHLPRRPRKPHLSRTPCYDKQSLTFADALFAVRRELWQTCLLRPSRGTQGLNHLPRSLRSVLLWHLAAAA